MGTQMMMLTSYNDVMGINMLMLEQNQILHFTPLATFTTTEKGANIPWINHAWKIIRLKYLVLL